MTTYGERFEAEVDNELAAARQISERHYSVDDVRGIVSVAGTRLELFLKGVAFPASDARKNLSHFIDRLSAHGVSAETTEALHDLRREYNRAKHDPAYEPKLLGVLDLLRRFRQAAREVVALGLGITGRLVRDGTRRVFWVAACDHYIGGDTEVHVYLPAQPEGWPVPPSLDLVYIAMEAWDDVREALAVTGELGPAEGHLPEGMLELFSQEEGFLEAFVFEGDYRDLLTTLTQHERRLDLIPGLRRQDNLRAMVQAFLLAAIDVASVGDDPDQEDLSREIKAQAVQVYAVSEDFEAADDLAGGMARMVRQVGPAERKFLAGPIWVASQDFDLRKQEATALHPNYRVLIDKDRTVCMEGL